MRRKTATIICVSGVIIGFLLIQFARVDPPNPLPSNITDPDDWGDERTENIGRVLEAISLISLILVRVFMKRERPLSL